MSIKKTRVIEKEKEEQLISAWKQEISMSLFDYQAILPLCKCKAWVNDWINDLNLIVAMVNFIIQTLASCFSGLAWTAFPVAIVSFIGTVIALIVKKKKPGKNELIDV